MLTPTKPGWLLCEYVQPRTESAAGLYLGRDMEQGKVAEGLCKVLKVSPYLGPDGTPAEMPVEEGDVLIFREYLRFANPVGRFYSKKAAYVFLMDSADALAVVPRGASVTVGVYGEFSTDGVT